MLPTVNKLPNVRRIKIKKPAPGGIIEMQMKLGTLAKLGVTGLFYIYIAKLIDTLYPGIFRPAAFICLLVFYRAFTKANLIKISFEKRAKMDNKLGTFYIPLRFSV
jgi:hypothetical protein